MLMSPLIFIPSLNERVTPPTSCKRSAFLTSSCPKISGAMDEANLPYGSVGSYDIGLRRCIYFYVYFYSFKRGYISMIIGYMLYAMLVML